VAVSRRQAADSFGVAAGITVIFSGVAANTAAK
jgi:hypothetical protein